MSHAADGYIDAVACAGCHIEIWEVFRESGMGRSFRALDANTAIADFETENVFHHARSERSYRMERRSDGYYMRRWEIGFDGQPSNVVEKRIDYVLGSGLKARTYLSRTPGGELLQLPVAWYSDKGGFWAMNPSYDRPDHDGFRRRIPYDCMFCHNAYPGVSPGTDRFDAERILYPELPDGIDCQRCHGPGRAHVESIADGSGLEDIRSTIVNPARLDPERQLEICLQCHLQSTSTRLPYAVDRPGRGVFSYRAGEPLGDYAVHFDHKPGAGRDDKFEIAHAAYRLMQSQCFARSNQGLTCTNCHDPHRSSTLPAQERSLRYRSACERCHGESLRALVADGRHTSARDCVHCHMPQRRTDDVVHVVMTDHRIQRPRAGASLLAPKDEIRETAENAYRGEVVPYYPPAVPESADDELIVAVAQLKAGANSVEGIPRLESLLVRLRPSNVRYYFELAEALRRSGRPADALRWYEQALRQDPDFLMGLRSYGMALAETGQHDRAESIYRKALGIVPDDPRTLHNLGLALLQSARPAEAARTLRRSRAIQPDSPETHNALASALFEAGKPADAEAAFREAVRLQPDYALARGNLARLLAATGREHEAAFHWKRAVADGAL